MTKDITTPQFNKVLGCLGESPKTRAIVSATRQVALALRADIGFVHVGCPSDEWLRETTFILKESGITEPDARLIVEEGKVADTVLRVARRERADFIVAGAMEKEGPLEYFIGSAARKIVRKAECPVLLLTDPPAISSLFDPVVAAMDCDEEFDDLIRCALAMTRRNADAALHIIHEYEVPALRQGIDDDLDFRGEEQARREIQAEEDNRLLLYLGGFDLSDVRLVRECVCGRKGWEAVEYARRTGAELLVLSAPQRRLGLLDKLFPHDVEFALQALPCSCLFYRRTEIEDDESGGHA
jgi:nucleotide-binding universal stress UspA family protein